MKIDIACACGHPRYTVTVSGADSIIQKDESHNVAPDLYPGLKELKNPGPSDIVEYVITHRPTVQWTTSKKSDNHSAIDQLEMELQTA